MRETNELTAQTEALGIRIHTPAEERVVLGDLALTQPHEQAAIEVRNLFAYYGSKLAVRDVSFDAPQRSVTAIIGPSGSGKSTVLRALNRMLEVVPGARIEGSVHFHGSDLYAPDVDPTVVRRTIGMVFQQPNPFPTMSIYDNVAAAARFNGVVHGRAETDDLVQSCLTRAALWDEVKDSLGKSGASLSGGQQQRLCIARALAVNPEMILMDEPCSALDPIATLQIEQLARELAVQYSIVIVTHNMQQAARVSDQTIFMSVDEQRAGYVVETGSTAEIFTNPKNKITEDYITGRFG
jgi:phosphate transport system ATP-binding protein